MLNCRMLCLLAAVPLWGGARQAAFEVALYTQFEHAPSAAVLESMQNEVETIMAPMGAEFEWRALDNVNGNEVSAQLAVVKFQGRCDPSGPGIRLARGRALGWTHVSDGAILPFSDIDCDGIREFTQFGLQAIDAKERAEAYGRALGRVLAHELYHIFANTPHHGSNGVGKAVYSVQDLLSKEFHFEERESEALRSNRTRVIDTTDATH